MKPLTEIRKGCGIELFGYVIPEIYCIPEIHCGELSHNKVALCPTCQALLEQAQEFEKMIEKLKSKAFKTTDYYDQVMAIKLDDLNELLKEVQGEGK